jgi:hypothetical protein
MDRHYTFKNFLTGLKADTLPSPPRSKIWGAICPDREEISSTDGHVTVNPLVCLLRLAVRGNSICGWSPSGPIYSTVGGQRTVYYFLKKHSHEKRWENKNMRGLQCTPMLRHPRTFRAVFKSLFCDRHWKSGKQNTISCCLHAKTRADF